MEYKLENVKYRNRISQFYAPLDKIGHFGAVIPGHFLLINEETKPKKHIKANIQKIQRNTKINKKQSGLVTFHNLFSTNGVCTILTAQKLTQARDIDKRKHGQRLCKENLRADIYANKAPLKQCHGNQSMPQTN